MSRGIAHRWRHPLLGALLALGLGACGAETGSPGAPDAQQASAPSSAPNQSRAADAADEARGIAFSRRAEPREGAFTLLVPRGWSLDGGIFRVDAARAGGPLNALEAKCDLTLRNDSRGTVALRILPDVVYAHPGIGAGMWAPGSNYQGAVVRPLERAQDHLRTLFHELRPTSSDVRIVQIHVLPGEVEALRRGQAFANALLARIGAASMAFRHDAAGAVFDYVEEGRAYREVLMTGIVDMPAALTWKNTRSIAFRAPRDEFDRWRPVLDIVRSSVRFDPGWVLREAKGQKEQADFAMQVFDAMRRIDGEIARRSRVHREEIMNDNYLVLTGQEEYVNPHTSEVERDTGAFRFRWVTPGEDYFYTDREDVDPNRFSQRTDFRRTPVRERRTR